MQRWRWMACTAMYSPACWWLPRLLVVLLVVTTAVRAAVGVARRPWSWPAAGAQVGLGHVVGLDCLVITHFVRSARARAREKVRRVRRERAWSRGVCQQKAPRRGAAPCLMKRSSVSAAAVWQMVPGTKLVAAERSLLPDDVLGDSGVAHGEAAEMGDLSQPPVDPRRSSDASPAFGLMNTGCAPKSASSAASSGSSGHVRFLHGQCCSA